jgi:hypothetical protein
VAIRTYDLIPDTGARNTKPQASVWFLLNPDDDPAIPATLGTPDAQRRGIVLVRLNPLSSSRTELSIDVLLSLGATRDGIEQQHVDVTTLPRVVTARLCGLRPAVLAIDCPHALSVHQLTAARRWCDHAQAQLVLIARNPTTYPYLTTTLEDLMRRPAHPPAAVTAWPAELLDVTLPADDFPVFRASVRHLLPHLAPLIDDIYTDTYDSVRSRLPTDHAADYSIRRAALFPPVFGTLTDRDPPASIQLIKLRALQAALLTHDATLLWWMPTPTTSLTSRLYPSLTPRHHGDHLATVLDPVSAAVNLLAGYFELPIGDLIKLSSTDLQLDDIDTTQHAQKPSPALMLGNQRLFLPRWTMPVLRTYLCLRDHLARSRAPGSPELFQRDGTGLDWHQAWNAQRDAGYRNTYGYVEAPTPVRAQPAASRPVG